MFIYSLIGYRLVIICSNEGEGKSNIISRLYSYRREWNIATDEDIDDLKRFLEQNIARTEDVDVTDVNADDTKN